MRLLEQQLVVNEEKRKKEKEAEADRRRKAEYFEQNLRVRLENLYSRCIYLLTAFGENQRTQTVRFSDAGPDVVRARFESATFWATPKVPIKEGKTT